MKYIDADRLRAEINETINEIVADALDPDAGIEKVASAKYKKDALSDALNIIDSLQEEQPMPDSTKLIELWHEDKEMLKEKDFRDDPWRLAYNAFMCGFGRGIAVNKQEQPDSPSLTERSIVWFENIAANAKRLSAGNVSHLGPTIVGMAIRSKEFLEKHKQDQPEVDLENEIGTYFQGWTNCDDYSQALNAEGECVCVEEVIDIARHFYNLGFNARKV